MGIHGLAKLIADQAPGAIKENDIKSYFGTILKLFYTLHPIVYDTRLKNSMANQPEVLAVVYQANYILAPM